MKVGFTGTRRGMTKNQKKVFADVMSRMAGQFHFGDCIGADEEAFNIVKKIGRFQTYSHPPSNERYRAYCAADVILPPEDYLVRNQSIVIATSVLVATPGDKAEELRSGTWSTIRKATQMHRKIIIIEPDGVMSIQEF